MSNNYLTKREQAYAKILKYKVDNYSAEIKKQLDQSYSEIVRDINAFYQIYAEREKITMSEAKKRADKFDVQTFSEQAKAYVKNRDFSDKANSELRLYNLKMKVSRLELLQNEIALELFKMSDKVSLNMETRFRDGAVTEYKRQAGILGESIHYTRATVDALLYSSYETATFMDVWNNQRQVLNEKLDQILRQALISGKNPTKFIGEIRKAFDVTHYQAKRLLLTETSNLQTKVQADCLIQAGYEYYEMIAESGACSKCSAVASSGPMLLKDLVRGVNAPPMHPNCVCSIVPAVKPKEKSDNVNRIDRNQQETMRERFRKAINDGIIKSNINIQKHNVHIKGTLEYERRLKNNLSKGKQPQSYLLIDSDQVKELIDRYSGKGRFKFAIDNMTPKQEKVKYDKPIGVYVDPRTGEKMTTTDFKIHYSKTGAHIVPTIVRK